MCNNQYKPTIENARRHSRIAHVGLAGIQSRIVRVQLLRPAAAAAAEGAACFVGVRAAAACWALAAAAGAGGLRLVALLAAALVSLASASLLKGTTWRMALVAARAAPRRPFGLAPCWGEKGLWREAGNAWG